MTQHYSTRAFFRQVPNALLAWHDPRRCVKGVR